MNTQSPVASNAFSESDDPALSYRPISPMAVVSLILGVASLGAFFIGILWIIPPIALIVAGMTSHRLEQARLEYAGQFAAKFGLLLAVVSFCGAPTIHYTKRFILGRESRVLSDRFIDLLLEYQLKEAFACTARPDLQTSANGDATKILDRRGKEEYQGFLSKPLLGIIGGKGADVQVSHTGFWYAGADKGVERVIHRYLVTIFNEKNEQTGVFSVPILVSGGTGAEWAGRKWMIEMFDADPYDPNKPKSGSQSFGN